MSACLAYAPFLFSRLSVWIQNPASFFQGEPHIAMRVFQGAFFFFAFRLFHYAFQDGVKDFGGIFCLFQVIENVLNKLEGCRHIEGLIVVEEENSFFSAFEGGFLYGVARRLLYCPACPRTNQTITMAKHVCFVYIYAELFSRRS